MLQYISSITHYNHIQNENIQIDRKRTRDQLDQRWLDTLYGEVLAPPNPSLERREVANPRQINQPKYGTGQRLKQYSPSEDTI